MAFDRERQGLPALDQAQIGIAMRNVNAPVK
jgi:hypothetical protein